MCPTIVRGPYATNRGFTYLVLLCAIAAMGVGLDAAAQVWSASARRERVAQLDWIGSQFIEAIGSYYVGTPGIVVKTFPKSLDDLVEDKRFVFIRRHLRRVYANPLTGQPDWQLVRAQDGGICGVRVELPSSYGGGTRNYVFNAASGTALQSP
jgi:type II secretory pathway pseudopilin PulG